LETLNSAVETAWTDVASKLRGYIRSRVRDHSAAEDILQDVFVKAHTRISQLESSEKIANWLHLIARNAVIDYYRKSKPTLELPEGLAMEVEDVPALENAEALRASFQKMVFNLPEPYREAVLLTEYEGLTQKELATRLGISISGAKSRVQRGREKLKNALLDCCRLEFDRRGSVIDCEPQKTDCDCGK
jgi:RNA polymerase sigma-70 factor (ECF subfamily)